MPVSLQSYAAYLPTARVAVAAGRPDRVAAMYDEDSTTMAVAAGAAALRGPDRGGVRSLQLATSSPAYLDKTNAVAVHAALGLRSDVFAADAIGSGRSAVAVLRGALSGGGLAISADVRVGRPGSADELHGGDGAVAFLAGPGPGIADILAQASRSAELLDRWRDPARTTAETWEERFGLARYAPLLRDVAAETLAAGGVEQADHVVVASPNFAVRKRAAELVAGRVGTRCSPIGFSGTADLGIALADVLDVAEPHQTVLVLSAVDGCDSVLLRTTALLPGRRQPVPVREQLALGHPVPHLRYLAWRGLVHPEPPRRPEPDRPAAPPAARAASWKFGFAGSRCVQCAFVHLPPAERCSRCGSALMEPAGGGALLGTVASHTVDHLAHSPSPPTVLAVVDFDGGGRSALEVADDAADLAVGDRIDLTFRRLFTAGDVHNYFWKARMITSDRSAELVV